MHFIKLIKSHQKNIYVSGIRVEVSEACCNLPTMRIDGIQTLNVNDLSAEVFTSEEQALNAVLRKISVETKYDIPWFKKGANNVFIARVLTDCNGNIATDQDISQWKNGILQLNLMDIYVTLTYR